MKHSKKVSPLIMTIVESILKETMGMSDLYYIIGSIKNMDSVTCHVQPEDFTIKLSFMLDGLHGNIWFRPRKNGKDIGEVFNSALRSVAYGMLRGKHAITDEQAQQLVNGRNIRSRAIRTLTNIEKWEVVKLRYDNFKIDP